MKVLHISSKRNKESILKHGILKRPPFLEQFKSYLEERLGRDYVHKEGIVFCMPEDLIRRDKYIKDFIYWKVWGHPRNVLIDALYKKHEYELLQESGPKLFKSIKIKEDDFHIYEIDLNCNFTIVPCYHGQFHSMSKVWDDMDSRYEHGMKPLSLVNNNISPNRFKIVGDVKVILNKKERVNILLNI